MDSAALVGNRFLANISRSGLRLLESDRYRLQVHLMIKRFTRSAMSLDSISIKGRFRCEDFKGERKYRPDLF